MSCELSTGFGLGCKTDSGGINEIFLVPLEDVIKSDISYDVTTDEISALPTMTVYRYTLEKDLSSFNDVGTYENSGSVHFVQTGNIILKNLTSAKKKELEKVMRNRVVMFVRRNESRNYETRKLMVLGLFRGLDITSLDAASGAALGDMSGYTITFTGDEPEGAAFLEPYTTNPFDNFPTVMVDPAYAT